MVDGGSIPPPSTIFKALSLLKSNLESNMKTSYATMVGAICLDKATDGDGNPAPITFSVRKVVNGNEPWRTSGGNVTLEYGCETLADAVKALHGRFIRHLQDAERGSSFWRENYRAMRSKWQSWMKKQQHSFSYDNYQICIVTSNGDQVW
jgi:hypothetical protein